MGVCMGKNFSQLCFLCVDFSIVMFFYIFLLCFCKVYIYISLRLLGALFWGQSPQTPTRAVLLDPLRTSVFYIHLDYVKIFLSLS